MIIMGYTSQNFKDGEVLTATHLLNIENGILDNMNAIKELNIASGNVEKSFEGKVISILGDSISTFEGWIPVADGHNLTHRKRYPQDNLLTDVKLTWWHRLITNLGAKLGINDSWAGSRVHNSATSNSGDFGPDSCMASITRITNLGANGTPDIILFYGGTNDAGGKVTIGSFDSTVNHNSVDLTSKTWTSFADAYKTAIMRLQYYYPDAKIISLLPMWTTSYYTINSMDAYGEIVKSICDYFGVPVIDLRACGINWQNKGYTLGDGIHPTAKGMDLMEKYIRRQLLSFYEGDYTEHVVYTVTNDLKDTTNVDRYIKGVSAGKSYTAQLTGEFTKVCVRMGGKDITSSALNVSTGVISISSVTGDITIDESGGGDYLTITYKYVDSAGKTIKDDTTGYALAESIKNFNTSTAPSISGYAIASVSPSGDITINDNITVTYTYNESEMVWYIDHTEQPDKFTTAVNIAGRGWCHVPESASYNAFVGKPINTIGFYTNMESQDVTVVVGPENGSIEDCNVIATVTATNPSGATKGFVTISIPETTLNDGECLMVFSQADSNINFYYSASGPVNDKNGIADGSFYGRVPIVYGSGDAWSKMANQYCLGWSIGYNRVK